MADASNQALQNALLSRTITPQVTEEAIRARYQRDIAGKAGEEEVHARHILVANEADAVKIIAELKAGGDFVAIAKARSTDPGAQDGGDLGFFKKGDMVPEFADAAFAMKPGQISDKPVHTQYGWHIIKVEERRAAPPPTFEQARDELRQKMIQEDIQALLVQARAGVQVQKFNADGSVPRPTDNAQPPPAPPKK
jgi:peptidyl-prolyl cis-trans isomerase C